MQLISVILFGIFVIALIVFVVVIIDYFLIKNSYKELGISINKIFDRASKIAFVALIISLFHNNNDSSES